MRKLKVIFSWVLALALVLGLLPVGVSAAETDGEPAQGDIVIVYTNDIHCGVDQKTDAKTGEITNIGYAGVAACKKEMEGKAGADNVTLVDAGDAVQGDAIGTLSKGEYLTAIIKQVGYDIFVPGNHEFDYGMEQMQKLMGQLTEQDKVKVISCNFTDLRKPADSALVYESYTIVTYGQGDNEKKVAYVGVTTPESFTKSTPAYFQDENGNYIYGFREGNNGQELYGAVQSTVDKAKAAGADYVIAIGHLGIDEQSEPWRSTDVIANTTGIDAFIDGHSHSTVEGEVVKNKAGEDVLLTQTGTKLENIGRMIIKPNGTITSSLIKGYDRQDADTANFIKNIEAEFEEDLAEKIGKTDVALTVNDPETGKRIVRFRETNLGDLCTDAYRYVLGNGKPGSESGPADIAFVNGGGVRDNIGAGDITFGEVIAVHPFNNVGCVVEATGQEILDALEMGARVAPAENGGFLQVSGLTYTIDTSIPSPVVVDEKKNFVKVDGTRRVKNVKVGDEPIDVNKTYTLASHNYMLLDGGDGINMFRDNKVVVQPVILDNQILISYIQDYLNGTVGQEYSNPSGQGRIKGLTPATGFENGTAALGVRQIARYSTGIHDLEGGVQEIITYNPINKFSYSVNGKEGVLTTIDLDGLTDNPSVAVLTGSAIDVKTLVNEEGFTCGDMTSVAVSPDGNRLAAAIQAEDYDKPGRVAIFTFGDNGSLNFDKAYETGVQPDMVVFADNDTILTADEGEPRESYAQTSSSSVSVTTDPAGSVTFVDLEEDSALVLDFTDFDAKRQELLGAGVVLKKDTAPSVDLEPEYIAVVGDKAYITLQEANAVAVLDLASKEFTGIYSAGVQDYSDIPIDLDNTSEEEDGGAYTPRYYNDTYGLRMPDGIAAYQANGKTYILTANEGDSREWGDKKKGTKYKNEDEEKLTATDGTETSKDVRTLTADYEGQPGLADGSKNYLFGGRSFSLFEAADNGLTLIYDSGSDFESKTAAYLPDFFNCSNDDIDIDSRSNKKGPEPETVTIGTVDGKTYAFIALERIGGVMVYDITDPENVSYVNYINSRDFSDVDGDGIGFDDSPEGLKFIPAAVSSTTGSALLLAAFEVSGDVAAYKLAPYKPAPEEPEEPDDDNDDDDDEEDNGGSQRDDSDSDNSSQNKTETVTNPDGSKTTKVTDAATGTVTETTIWEDGSKTIVEKKKDGTVTTTAILANGVKSETVTTPDGETTSNITLPSNVTSIVARIPVPNADAGTVAVLVHADGTEEIIRGSVAQNGELLIPLSGSAVIKVKHSGISFPDTDTHWASEAVTFVTARGLFEGTSESIFSPDTSMTRGMLVTVLHRLENTPEGTAQSFDEVQPDMYYADAIAWAAQNNIVEGMGDGSFQPDGNITREQLAVILYRYAKPEQTDGNLEKFSDGTEVSSWAAEAMRWAVGSELFVGDNGRLNPTESATRAEVATILQRFITYMAQD